MIKPYEQVPPNSADARRCHEAVQCVTGVLAALNIRPTLAAGVLVNLLVNIALASENPEESIEHLHQGMLDTLEVFRTGESGDSEIREILEDK